MIERAQYLKQLIAWKNAEQIKIITGVRRCGKSTLLWLFKDHLLKTADEKHIIFLNLEKADNFSLHDPQALYDYLVARMTDAGKYYLLLDEIGEVSKWEEAIYSLFAARNVDLYLTSSNAIALRPEFESLLSGKYVIMDMLPLSFREYYDLRKESKISKDDLFSLYLEFGSFPAVPYLGNEILIRDYLTGLYHTILVKDIALKGKVKDVNLLTKMTGVIFSTIGNPISANKITENVNKMGSKTTNETVLNYLRMLEESHLVYKVPRYNIRSNRYLKTQGKYYCCDTGIRNNLVPSDTRNYGFLIENIVFLELFRRGYSIAIGKNDINEIDFRCQKDDDIKYIQVSLTLSNEKTREREFGAYKNMKENHPKYMITMDRDNLSQEGITHINLVDFLLDENLI
jgi:predicted AAA+ superfamily ATPase